MTVHPAGVDGDHCRVEVGEVVSLLDCGAEVFDVTAGLADVFRAVGVAVSLVAGDDRAGLEPLDGVQGVEPFLPAVSFRLGEVQVHVSGNGRVEVRPTQS